MKDVYNYLAKEAPEYWSESNRRFEESDPTYFQRMQRTLNPVTAFGSSWGDFRDSAENRDGWGMGLAAASALPTFGATRFVQGFLDKVPHAVTSFVGTAKNAAVGSAAGGLSDIYHYDGPEEARLKGGLREAPSDQQLKERAAFIERYRSVMRNQFNPAATQAVQKQEAQPYPMTPVPKRNTP